MEAVFENLATGAAAAARMLLAWLFPLAVLTLLLHLCQRSLRKSLTRLAGPRGPILVGIVGTPLHELSHAAMCVVFRHKIHSVALFRPDPQTGTLGYVNHSYDRRSFYQRTLGVFAVGIAPLFGGALAIAFLSWLLVPGLTEQGLSTRELGRWIGHGDFTDIRPLVDHAAALLGYLFTAERLSDWRFYLFLALTVSIGAHLAPSGQDWKNVRRPLAVLLALAFVSLTIAESLGVLPPSVAGAVTSGFLSLAAVLLLALTCCAAAAVLMLPVGLLRRR